ncbi:di-heme oxidoredictase family protein [Chryseolinea sp. T2]|uniref:di-heme oxidoreductase family protein n=1 Tax=Chryseolinea sp. T2 TaxID=3129255 RepID=UPI0030778FC4
MRVGRIIKHACIVVGALITVYACVDPDTDNPGSYNEWLSGGSQTIFDNGAGAFSTAFPSMTEAHEAVHEAGDVAFEQTFVTVPSPVNPGLGPIFNNVSCTSCHINDGRGKPPVGAEQITSLLIRVSIAGEDSHGGPNPAPGFGVQLQQRSVYGKTAEAQVKITYVEKSYTFGDGESYSLRFPTYELQNPYTSLPPGLMVSPRIAPPVFGLGLLQAVAESDIVALADADDKNDDGISGKPNYVWNVLEGKRTLGRFGWKANNPTILQQSAGAYNEDMGITNFVFERETSWDQPQYDGLSDEYEVSDSLLHSVEFYIRTLAVPARRAADNVAVLAGKQIFADAKCGACHVPRLRTATDVAFREVSNQVIYPYTDLLLHDMGPDLADNRPDFDANGQEWRTSPLWGIGLTRIVNGHQNFLHDGRARTLIEAIMWHGGEAAHSKDYVRSLSRSDRDALVKFIESL